jgi:hypothetical protein
MAGTELRIRRVRGLLALFILGLTVSGVTAIPLNWEMDIASGFAGPGTTIGQLLPQLAEWIGRVGEGVRDGYGRYPFLAYGTDWLAFGHIAIAIAFVGALRDPRKNLWVIEFGMIACALVVPWALIFGALRGIPFFWRLIDTSFGVFGIIPLWLARREIVRLRS